MKRSLNIGTKIRLNDNSKAVEFTVDGVKGTGGSCVAYEVSFYESGDILHKGVLKEFCPAYLGEVLRTSDNSIIVPVYLREKFDKGVNDFKASYRFVNSYIAENEVAANNHPVLLGLFEGNNTVYSLSSYDFGKDYASIKDENLYSLIKIAIAVTKAIQRYHNAGFVHCDIKPENIFILDDVTDLIKLFDYDSLLKIDDLKKGLVEFIPDPKIYYVPELAECNQRNIGIATDIFEIGAMIYYRLFSKSPSPSEMERDAQFDFDQSDIMDGVSPRVKYEVHKLLKNTMQVSVRRRYKSTKELLHQLYLILENLDSKKPYLLNLPVWQPTRIRVERTSHLNDIHSRLQKDGYVFIKGMGGLGKSELSKMYVEKFRGNYHTIQFCKYVDSIKSLVVSLPMSGIKDEEYDNIEQLFKIKNKILHKCDSNTLLIVDNFNVTHDKHLREFLPSDNSGFKVIFTTRCMPAADYYEDKVFSLPELSIEESKSLFYLHNPIVKTPQSDMEIEHLVREIQHNTLLLILIAKMMKRTSIDIETVINKLEEQELNSLETKVFYEYDYVDEDVEVYNKINNHLNIVYNISGLKYYETQTLLNMTLISLYGIEVDEFIKACDDNSITKATIYALESQGWIDINEGMIFMHSIISDVVAQQDIERQDSFYLLAYYLEDQCYVDEESHITDIQKALAIAKQLQKRYKGEEEGFKACLYFVLATIYLALYRPKETETFLKKSLSGFESTGDYESIPVVYNKLGEYESKFGTNTKAIFYYNESIRVAEESGSTKFDNIEYDHIAVAMNGIADCYKDEQQLHLALEQYKKLFDRLKRYGLDELDSLLKDIINIAEELDEHEDVRYYSKILRKCKKNPLNFAKSYEKSTSEMFDAGEIGEFYKKYEAALSEYKETLGEDSPAYKDIEKYRWFYYLLNGQEVEAERMLAESMSFIEQTYGYDSMEMADYISVVAPHMIERDNIKYGIELSERAIQICRKNHQETSYTYAKAKMNLIVANVVMGDSYAAEEIMQTLDLDRYSGAEYLCDIIKSVGLVYVELGYYEEIFRLANKVIELKNADKLSKVAAYEMLLMNYEKMGELDKAERCLAKIKESVDTLSTLEYAKSYLLIYYRMDAKIHSARKNNIEALRSVDKAIDLYDDKLTYCLIACYQERCIYNLSLERLEDALRDTEMCRKIIERYSLSPKANIMVFNNIALIYYKKADYVQAEKCYQEIVQIHPDVLNPTNSNDATICQMYGLTRHELGDEETAEKYILTAMDYYENNGFEESPIYFTAKYNLSLVYAAQNRYRENLDVLLDLYGQIDKVSGSNYTHEIHVATSIVVGLIFNEKREEAYEFALNEDKIFSKKYGRKSIERIDYLQQTAGMIKYCGYKEAYHFLNKSKKLIEKAGLENSIYQARQLNYVGVCFLDLEEEFGYAVNYLRDAKELLEELSQQETPFYELVCSNLELAEEKNMDDICKKLVESLSKDN